MSDFGSEIVKKYGTAAVIFAVVASLVIWSLAHWTAAPGKEISVLWGLVKYTKRPEASFTNESNKALTTKQEAQKENKSDELPAISVLVKQGITAANQNEILLSLRRERKLRELTAVESGKKISDVPVGTFFFLFGARITDCYSKATVLLCVDEQVIRRYPKSDDFEIHYLQNGELHLIGYVSEERAAEIAKLPGNANRNITISPYPLKQMTSLISLPINRMQSSHYRDMEVSQKDYITVLDAVVK